MFKNHTFTKNELVDYAWLAAAVLLPVGTIVLGTITAY